MTDKTLCECGKWMIKRSTGIVLTSYPPRYPMMWWCACGKTKPAETIYGKTDEQYAREEWEKENQ